MALNASDIKLVLPHAEFIRSVSPSGVTNIAKRKGIGGLTRSKLLTHEIEVKLEGDITSPQLLKALLGTSEMQIDIHDVSVTGALASEFELGITADEPITFSATLSAKNISAITPGTPTIPSELFSKSEGILLINKARTDINELSISGSRNLEPVYGGTGATVADKMKPTAFKIGSWEYSAEISIEPNSINDLIKLWDPTLAKWIINAYFIDAVDETHTFGFIMTGGIVSSSSGDINSDELSATQTIEVESFDVGYVKKETFNGDGTTTDFVLTETPLDNSVAIFINGVEETNFNVADSTVSFDTVPENGANIEIYYLKEVIL